MKHHYFTHLKIIYLLLFVFYLALIWKLAPQNDLAGKLIIGGEFTTYSGTTALNISRILPAINSLESRQIHSNCIGESEILTSGNFVNDLVIYPNPSDGLFTLKTSDISHENFNLSIYSVFGQRVFHKIIYDSSELLIDLKHLTKGTYFLSVDNDATTRQKTLIIN